MFAFNHHIWLQYNWSTHLHVFLNHDTFIHIVQCSGVLMLFCFILHRKRATWLNSSINLCYMGGSFLCVHVFARVSCASYSLPYRPSTTQLTRWSFGCLEVILCTCSTRFRLFNLKGFRWSIEFVSLDWLLRLFCLELLQPRIWSVTNTWLPDYSPRASPKYLLVFLLVLSFQLGIQLCMLWSCFTVSVNMQEHQYTKRSTMRLYPYWKFLHVQDLHIRCYWIRGI